MTRRRLLLSMGLVCLLSALGSHRAAAEMIASITFDQAEQVLRQAGLRDIRDRTSDPAYPSVGGLTEDGFTIQITLHSCHGESGDCSAASIVAFIPSTTAENALRIERSVDQGVAAADARVILEVGDVPAIVELSHYLLLGYGTSDKKLPLVVDYLLNLVSQTKAFMLSDDPNHAELWSRNP